MTASVSTPGRDRITVVPDGVYSVDEIARWADVSAKTVRREIAAGRLQVGRAGTQIRILGASALMWLFGSVDYVP